VKINMDIKLNDQKGNVTVWPEKLYTQQEVDGLLEKRGESFSSRAREIEEESHYRFKNLYRE